MINDLVIAEKARLILKETNKAVFEIKPLSPGYGVTIGNALRRVLLSSLTGAAITRVKIQDVLHEFSTIPGVLEDVLDITLNLKKVRFSMDIEGPVELELNAKGKGEVKAKDIKLVSGINIANPEQLIATLTKESAELKMVFTVEKGKGFSPAEERMKERSVAGEIVMDAIFSPVVNAVYEIENIRYLDRTDFNLLRLTIETDGTKDPEVALEEAVKILINQLEAIIK
ncbi:MAG: DNA-directed RNA polymerase subunit alpha [Patescibacteria group bacterium]|nr:DNA-directed RNA polymerase subunit alpha [Patescibacteria group bacterium]